MYDKNGIIQFMKELGIPEAEYCLIAGASLVMHDIKKETEDIDLSVSENGAEILRKKYSLRKSDKPYPNHYTVTDEFEIVIQDLSQKSIYLVNKIPCNNVLEEYLWKKEHNRPKDQEILQVLEGLMARIAKQRGKSINDLTEQDIEEYMYKGEKDEACCDL